MGCIKHYMWIVLYSLTVQIILSQNGCPSGLTSELDQIFNYNGNCYYFSETALSYSQANNSCAQNNGFLAVIPDNATHTALSNLGDQISDITARSSYWIGYQRQNTTFTSTVLGNPSEYTNFASTGASGIGQTGCVQLALDSDDGPQWITDDCSSTIWYNGYICQFYGTNGSKVLSSYLTGMFISILAAILLVQ